MDVQRLIAMANDIATFFDSADQAAAAESVRTHLAKFWEPRMRRQIIEHAETGGAGLIRTALEGVRLLMY